MEGLVDFRRGPQHPGVDLSTLRHAAVPHQLVKLRDADPEHLGGFFPRHGDGRKRAVHRFAISSKTSAWQG